MMHNGSADHIIRTEADLERHYGPKNPASVWKELDHIHPHYRAMIEASPFVAIGTVGPEGTDVTPKGDPAGFVHVADEKTLMIPDRPGNNRLDSWRNIIGDPRVSVLFLIPGVGETLRVNGRARLARDEALLSILRTKGDPPQLALVVDVEEVYLHCAKACMRSQVWDPQTWLPKEELPSAPQIYRDHRDTPGLTVAQVEAELEESFRTRMW